MLSGITAAVVGAILNLSVWFTLQTLFRDVHEWHPMPTMRIWQPEWTTLDVRAAAIAVLSILALFRWHWGMLWTLAAAAALGLVLQGW
jgi:chromate transporter